MPPEEQKQPEHNPGGPPENNGAANAEDISVIKAELEEEKKAKAAVEAAMAAQAKRITELEASLNVASQASEAAAAELSQAREAHTKAVSKYLGAVRTSNPTIPPDVIAGGTIDEIDVSLGKALTMAAAIRANLEAQAKQAKVPAGAPTRSEISLEGLSPREKITAGIQQKGGTS
jgi:hypothetical protein